MWKYKKILKNKTRRQLHKAMAVSVLLYGSQSWITENKDKYSIQWVEMRGVKGCTWRDLIRIQKELNICI